LVLRDIAAEFQDWRTTLARLILQPSVYLFVFAYVLGGIAGFPGGGDYVRIVAPGVAVMAVMQNAIQGAGGALLNGYYFRTMEAWLLAPVSLRILLLARVLSGTLFGVLGGIVASGIGIAMLGFRPHHPAFYLSFLLLGALFFALLALLAFVLPKYPDRGQEWLAFLMTPMGFFGCTFYTYAMLPPSLAPLALFVPTTYFSEGLRDAANGVSASFEPRVLWSGLAAALTVCLATTDWAFRRRFKNFLW
jgi:ABC-type multidrug transport system permease subunit